MTQFDRPDSDVSIATWTDDGGGTVNIYLAINETSPDTGDFIKTANNPANVLYVCTLSDIIDPLSSIDHKLDVYIGKHAAAGRQIDITTDLYQGATPIASFTETNIGVVSNFVYTLSGAEADSISNYNDLRVRINANAVGGGAGRAGRCAYIHFECPDGVGGGSVPHQPLGHPLLGSFGGPI